MFGAWHACDVMSRYLAMALARPLCRSHQKPAPSLETRVTEDSSRTVPSWRRDGDGARKRGGRRQVGRQPPLRRAPAAARGPGGAGPRISHKCIVCMLYD